PCPFEGGRMYSTGDRAVWQFDGTLQYRGRTDHQVKLHGIRVELGEIETALRCHPSVRDAVVILGSDDADSRLTAYVEPPEGQAVDLAGLGTFLRETLPASLVPTAFVAVREWPRTPNGKLNRGALPRPERTRQEAPPAHSTPETDTMRAVARLW